MATPSKRPQTRRRFLTGILPTLGMLLIASALFRLGFDSTAFAEAVSLGNTNEGHIASAANTLDVDGLMMVLKDRETAIEAKEQELLAREKAAEIAEKSIRNQLKHLEAAEQSLREKIKIAEQGTENDVAQLTEVYARMKPKNSAALFAQMEPAFAAGFLGRMKPDIAAAILAGMDPNAAYTISVVMAGRNANTLLEE